MKEDDDKSNMWLALMFAAIAFAVVCDQLVGAWKEVELRKIEAQNPQPQETK